MAGREEDIKNPEGRKGHGSGIGPFIFRQFAVEATRAQRIFDSIGILGVFFLMMLGSFWAKENLLMASRLGEIAFQRLNLQVDLFSLAAWGGFLCLLLKKDMHPALLIPLASTQFAGAALCLIVGLLILPIALFFLGPIVYVFTDPLTAQSWIWLVNVPFGLLFLLPWFPFFCFMRNGIRSIGGASIKYGPIVPTAVVVLILAVLLGVTWPFLGTFPPWDQMIEMWQDFDLL